MNLNWFSGRLLWRVALARVRQAHEEPFLRRAIFVDQRRRFALGEIVQTGFHDGILVVTNRPRGSLRFPIDRAMDGQRAVGHFVGVISSYDTLLVDGQLHDQLRMLMLIAHEREYAEW